MKRLRFYHRTQCPLCEEMLEQLEALGHTPPFELELIDVDTDIALKAGYGERVPVLEGGDGMPLCEVYLDPTVVLSYLRDA